MSCETLEDANDRIKQLERENLQLKQLLEDKQSGNSIDENKELQKAMATEQELRLIKALLLLQNVDVDVKLNENSKPRKVLLSGDADLLEELMTYESNSTTQTTQPGDSSTGFAVEIGYSSTCKVGSTVGIPSN